MRMKMESSQSSQKRGLRKFRPFEELGELGRGDWEEEVLEEAGLGLSR